MTKTILLTGTIPGDDLSLLTGTASFNNNRLFIGETELSMNRGTAAMIAAVCKTVQHLNGKMPYCILGHDIGTKDGSRNVYRYLVKNRKQLNYDIFGLHYIIPDIGLHNQVMSAIRKIDPRPILVADAGFMYVAKAAGMATEYDLFLPDLGELAFLADEKAAHPAYTRGFLTRLETDPKDLIQKAVHFKNAAKNLCVKGKTDYICCGNKILETVSSPVVEELEPIGGTGDTITGMAIGLIGCGYNITEACTIACRANREAGKITRPSPASQISDIIENIPNALKMLSDQ